MHMIDGWMDGWMDGHVLLECMKSRLRSLKSSNGSSSKGSL